MHLFSFELFSMNLFSVLQLRPGHCNFMQRSGVNNQHEWSNYKNRYKAGFSWLWWAADNAALQVCQTAIIGEHFWILY